MLKMAQLMFESKIENIRAVYRENASKGSKEKMFQSFHRELLWGERFATFRKNAKFW